MRYLHTLHVDSAVMRPLLRIAWPQRNVLGFGLLLAALLGIILAVPLSRASLIARGQPSPVTLEAPISLTYTSETDTRAAITGAESRVQPVYRTDPDVQPRQRKALVAALDTVDQVRGNPSLGRAGQIAALTAIASLPITPTLAANLLQFSDDGWQRVNQASRRLYDDVTRDRPVLTEAQVTMIRQRELPTAPELARLSVAQRQAILYLVGATLKPNSELDEARTEQRRAEARAGVSPIQVSVVKGEVVIRKGDVVSDAVFEKLTKLGLVRGAGGLSSTLQMLLLGLLVAWMLATYIQHCQATLWPNGRALLVIAGLLAVVLLAGRLLLPAWDTMPYVFPLATMSILLTVLFNGEVALVATLAMAPLLGLQHEQSIGLAITLALGAVAGIFTAQRTRRTGEFAYVALAVAIITALTAIVFWIGPGSDASSMLQVLLFSVINGALSGILAVGSYHFLGRVAGVVTPLELMELSHPNQPLLRRLMREAPGTYHHSIVVSNLAEVAAEDIGADPLLARVGAYYHDIGKMLRPYFFTDNQHDRSNVHDVLDAKTSASIIIDHVREGVKLAVENGLPQRVVDFISQHHGTNVVSFFYQRALQEDEDADIEDFRYPGPRPQTREAAIMMLADGVEATVRAMSQAGKLRPARPEENGEASGGKTIADVVEQIFNERIASQQLDEAPVTLRDISVIKESFIKTLQGIYHPRVDYTQTRARVTSETVTSP